MKNHIVRRVMKLYKRYLLFGLMIVQSTQLVSYVSESEATELIAKKFRITSSESQGLVRRLWETLKGAFGQSTEDKLKKVLDENYAKLEEAVKQLRQTREETKSPTEIFDAISKPLKVKLLTGEEVTPNDLVSNMQEMKTIRETYARGGRKGIQDLLERIITNYTEDIVNGDMTGKESLKDILGKNTTLETILGEDGVKDMLNNIDASVTVDDLIRGVNDFNFKRPSGSGFEAATTISEAIQPELRPTELIPDR